MKTLLLCFSFIFCNLFEVYAQRKISFVEEYIDFEINAEKFIINGIYLFRNNTNNDIVQQITFPFGMSTDSVTVNRVWDLTNGHAINYKILKESISFPVKFSSSDSLSLNIMYNQPVKKENKYILRSTQAWGEALKVATYSLSVKDFGIEQFSYAPDSVKENRYFWQKKDFFPEIDFVITVK
jgi:hypothetical protein